MNSIRTKNSCYFNQIRIALPRILSLFDTDPTSPTYGCGDRFYWSWKLIDFPNASYQAAAHGLARLHKASLLSEFVERDNLFQRIEAIFFSTQDLTRSNGSLEEAFPYESSYCVTALVAIELLNCIDVLGADLQQEKRQEYLDIVKPLIGFLLRSRETHGKISNHLACAAAALLKYSWLQEDKNAEREGQRILVSILRSQSSEGWFMEYEGADPGYQTICLYYLALIYRERPSLELKNSLERAFEFLSYFAHPDGSFGGSYGSRNTRFYCPAPAELLKNEIQKAASLARYMKPSIENLRTPVLNSFDSQNLIPFFNAYVVAATSEPEAFAGELPIVPCQQNLSFTKKFEEAGLIIEKTEAYYAIVSVHKGGAFYIYDYGKGRATRNSGVVIKSSTSALYSTQAYNRHNAFKHSAHTFEITSRFTRMTKQVMQPYQLLVLRVLNLSLMRNRCVRESVKKFLAWLLISRKKTIDATNCRTIRLGKFIELQDQQVGLKKGCERIHDTESFSAIHMASQGYWQKQDDLK